MIVEATELSNKVVLGNETINLEIREIPIQVFVDEGETKIITVIQSVVAEILNSGVEVIIEESKNEIEVIEGVLISPNIISTKRIVTSPYQIVVSDFCLYVDTDGGPIEVLLPSGGNGRTLRIINSGNSGNDVTVTPFGSELLIGVNESKTLSDRNVIDLTYNTTNGWL